LGIAGPGANDTGRSVNNSSLSRAIRSFLLLIGVSLIGDGVGMHIPKGYIYFRHFRLGSRCSWR